MALHVATEFTFGCGHRGHVDLSALPPDRRMARLAFLEHKGMCAECLRRNQHPQTPPGRRQ